jgi:hypothetical protein
MSVRFVGYSVPQGVILPKPAPRGAVSKTGAKEGLLIGSKGQRKEMIAN